MLINFLSAVMHYFKHVYNVSKKDIKQDVLSTYGRKKLSPCCSAFDKNSIMTYVQHSEYSCLTATLKFSWFCRRRYTFPSDITQEGVHVPLNYNLSDTDKAFVFLHYPRMVPHPDAPEWTIQHALDIADITGDRREEILQAQSPGRIREIFQQWCAERRPGSKVRPSRPLFRGWIGGLLHYLRHRR